MNASAVRRSSVTNDSVLNNLIDELTAKLQAGEAVDFDAVAAEHPDHADTLHRLIPALQVLADLSNSVGKDDQRLSGSSLILHPSSFPEGTLGDFRLIREVGRGGMGIVYEAEQISLRRRVALKVLPFAGTLDPRHLQRFRNEAQAAAHLHHTNIVPVYFVGSERGVHFYAMQFIEGQTLADVIGEIREEKKLNHRSTEDTEKKERTGPLSSLCSLCLGGKQSSYFRHIAELGIQAAEALDHAHEQGIVHRDIKPANLLFSPLPACGKGDGGEGAGHLWITDFGLAHCQSDAALTMSGDLIGTLRYMSPEQALAKRVPIDHRTDIYSLGATLYELLTLHPVIDGADRTEILRKLTLEEPKPLRKWNKSIPPELETIVLKALEKNPNDRYGTAKELADDLRRWTMDQPVRARKPSLIQRVQKLARRHKAVVTTAIVAAFLFLVVGGIGMWVSNARLKEETEFAQKQKTIAQDQKAEAEEQAAIAKAANDFLSALIRSASTSTQVTTGLRSNKNLTVKEVVDRTAQKVDVVFEDRPLIAAAIHESIGVAYAGLEQNRLAVQHLERAVELFSLTVGATNERTLSAQGQLGREYYVVGRVSDSVQLLESVRKQCNETLGTNHPETWSATFNSARVLNSCNGYLEVVKLLEPLRAELVAGLAKDEYSGLLSELALAYSGTGRNPDAITLHEQILFGFENTRKNLGPEMFNVMKLLGNEYLLVGRTRDSVRLLERAYEGFRRNFGSDSDHSSYAAISLADAYEADGRSRDAISLLEPVVAKLRNQQGEDSPNTQNAIQGLAISYKTIGRMADAISLYRQVWQRQLKLRGPEDYSTGSSQNHIAMFLQLDGQFDEAILHFKHLVGFFDRKFGRDNLDSVMNVVGVGNCERGLGRIDDAIRTLEDAASRVRRAQGQVLDVRGHRAILNLSEAYTTANQFDKAEAIWRDRVARSRVEFGSDSLHTADTLSRFSVCLLKQEKWDEAEAIMRECLAIQESKLRDDWNVFDSKSKLGAALLGQMKFAEAQPLLLDGYQGMKDREGQVANWYRPQIIDAVERIVQFHVIRGHVKEATEWRQKLDAARVEYALGRGNLDTSKQSDRAVLPQTSIAKSQSAPSPSQPRGVSDTGALMATLLELRKRKLGEDHPDTLTSMFELASANYRAGRYQEAAALEEKCLELRKAKLGAEHPSTLETMTDLAAIYFDLGRRPDALTMREELLKLHTVKLGSDHITTITAMVNLAMSYYGAGRHIEAIQLEEQALYGQRAKLGPDHPDTLRTMNNLALDYDAVFRFDEALKLREETAASLKATLGPDQQSTLIAMNNLAFSHYQAGRAEHALRIAETLLPQFKAKFGPEHPISIGGMASVALYRFETGRHSDAIRLLEECLALRTAKLGPKHPVTLATMNSLAWELAAVPDESLRNPTRAIELAGIVVNEIPNDAGNRNTLGMARYAARDWEGSIADLEKAMSLRKPEDARRANDGFLLAMAHWQRGDKDKAHVIFTNSVDWMEKGKLATTETKQLRADASKLLGENETADSKRPEPKK